MKGPKPTISEEAKYNVAKLNGNVDRHGNLIVKSNPCLIEVELEMRLKEKGESYSNTVPKKDNG